jgi:hypothetical protein
MFLHAYQTCKMLIFSNKNCSKAASGRKTVWAPHLVELMQAEVVQWIENNHVLVGRMIFKNVGQDEKFLMNNNTMIWISQKALALVSNSRIAITD